MAKLDLIRQQIIDHPANLWAKKQGYKPIYTASNKAKIAIIGQAPGRKAQESGIPWNDISGDNLRRWLNISKDIFYSDKIALIPMDFYFPGKDKHGDKLPRRDFAPLWHPQLFSLMPNIKLTILTGSYAQKYYLGKTMNKNLSETVRNYQDYLPDYLPLVHPSPLNLRWQSKNAWFAKNVLPHAQKLVTRILDK